MRYLQHRISQMWDVSKQLFDMGYLTIGWQYLAGTDLLERTLQEGEAGFSDSASKSGLVSRNRWCLYRFLTLKAGDQVIVPLYEKEFAIVEVAGDAQPICALPVKKFSSIENRGVVVRDYLYYEGNDDPIDLGYIVPYHMDTAKIVPRGYASAKLQARMKHQYINVDVEDCAEDIRKAMTAEAPVNLRDIILEATAKSVLESIHELTPDGFERLVQWYMQQCGATRVEIPAKNESGKENGADADVIAAFDHLGTVFYIQVKKHEGYTSDWAIKQISYYKAQKENKSDDFTYIPWVVSTASFTEEVREYAHEVGVRLIDGLDFAKMIVDTGIKNINTVMDYLK